MTTIVDVIDAIRSGNALPIKSYLQRGADVNAVDDFDRTLLMHAIRYNQKGIVELLLKAGADPNIKNNVGLRALVFASMPGKNKEIVELLLKAGADANLSNEQGASVLSKASENGDTELIDLINKTKPDAQYIELRKRQDTKSVAQNTSLTKSQMYADDEKMTDTVSIDAEIANQSDLELLKINANRRSYPESVMVKVDKELEKRGLTTSMESRNVPMTTPQAMEPSYQVMQHMTDNSLRCPKCGSTQLTADKKGFGWIKAAGGALATGGIGLLGGFIGSRKVLVTCLNCGKQWKAGS